MTLYIFSRNPYRIWGFSHQGQHHWVAFLPSCYPFSCTSPLAPLTLAVAVYQLLRRDLDFKAVLPPCPLQSQGRFSPSFPTSFPLPSLVLCIVTLKNFRSKEPTDWLFHLTTLAKLASNTGLTLYSVVFLYKCQNTKKSTAWFLGVFLG